MTGDAVLELEDVSVVRDGRAILDGASWTVRSNERWAVLGPNGSGKSTLLRVAGLWLRPTSGTVRVGGETSGRTDVRSLRARIGVTSAALAGSLRADVRAADVVMTGRRGALEPWWHRWSDGDRADAVAGLHRLGVGDLAERTVGTLSSGERQRVLLARALLDRPLLLLLDEPAAGLDLGAREDLLTHLEALAADPASPPWALVTHHPEEIPVGTTHALLLRGGRIVAAGPVAEVLADEPMSDAFGVALRVDHDGGRVRARYRSSG